MVNHHKIKKQYFSYTSTNPVTSSAYNNSVKIIIETLKEKEPSKLVITPTKLLSAITVIPITSSAIYLISFLIL